MIRRPPRSTRTDTLFPYTTLFRSVGIVHRQNARRSRRRTMATLEKVRVREYMSSRLMTFTPEMEVMNAVHQLVKSGHSGAPVVDARGKLVGMLSRSEERRVGNACVCTGRSSGVADN